MFSRVSQNRSEYLAHGVAPPERTPDVDAPAHVTRNRPGLRPLVGRRGPDRRSKIVGAQPDGGVQRQTRRHGLYLGDLHQRGALHRQRRCPGCGHGASADRVSRGDRHGQGRGVRRGRRLVHRRRFHRSGRTGAPEPGAHRSRPGGAALESRDQRGRAGPAASGHHAVCGRPVLHAGGRGAQPDRRRRHGNRRLARLQSRHQFDRVCAGRRRRARVRRGHLHRGRRRGAQQLRRVRPGHGRRVAADGGHERAGVRSRGAGQLALHLRRVHDAGRRRPQQAGRDRPGDQYRDGVERGLHQRFGLLPGRRRHHGLRRRVVSR